MLNYCNYLKTGATFSRPSEQIICTFRVSPPFAVYAVTPLFGLQTGKEWKLSAKKT